MDNLTSEKKEIKDTGKIKVDRGNMKIRIKQKRKQSLKVRRPSVVQTHVHVWDIFVAVKYLALSALLYFMLQSLQEVKNPSFFILKIP